MGRRTPHPEKFPPRHPSGPGTVRGTFRGTREQTGDREGIPAQTGQGEGTVPLGHSALCPAPPHTAALPTAISLATPHSTPAPRSQSASVMEVTPPAPPTGPKNALLSTPRCPHLARPGMSAVLGRLNPMHEPPHRPCGQNLVPGLWSCGPTEQDGPQPPDTLGANHWTLTQHRPEPGGAERGIFATTTTAAAPSILPPCGAGPAALPSYG